jgi:hypothetical protein
VLGAGASYPYGFPLGITLKTLVLDHFGENNHFRAQLLNTTEFAQRDIQVFIDSLRQSGLSSVDAFLERRPEFLEIGKATMAIELIFSERAANLWRGNGDWMQYLYSAMITKVLAEFAENRVAFITFNYDRTVEHFLSLSLLNSFGKPIAEVKDVMDRIPIIHLHGRLGHLEWQTDRGIRFGEAELNIAHMKIFRREIKVVHEDISDGRDRDFNEAKTLLGDAARVYLLGFGYGTTNVERLGLANIQPQTYEGTAFGLTDKETQVCSALLNRRVNLLNRLQALDFLRNRALLD